MLSLERRMTPSILSAQPVCRLPIGTMVKRDLSGTAEA
jgi:hypothetical protein